MKKGGVFMSYLFDFSDFESDLACERRRADASLAGVEYHKKTAGSGVWERIRITSREGEKSIGRPMGRYDTLTLERMDLLDRQDIYDASDEIAKELCKMIEGVSTTPESLLVVGLGNRDLTPDSVGPRSAELVNATLHIKNADARCFSTLECSSIATLSPGVSASSGMDAAEVVAAICGIIKPNAIIVIDSLAARSPARLGRTVQLSDTGIFPGSGIGNRRGAITKETVGAPVIAIGVPTVIDAAILAGENEMFPRKSMFVSPKEINGIVKAAARIISGGINQAFGIENQ